jgi:signal transduction histidine kinase/phage shock protein PspC (stress-responsive transcriptional regulator)
LGWPLIRSRPGRGTRFRSPALVHRGHHVWRPLGFHRGFPWENPDPHPAGSGFSPIPVHRRAVRACGRVFRRSSSDRVLTGVAGGIGERLGIDPLVVRLAFVVLSLAGGVGLLLYVAAALVSRGPEPETQPESPPRTGVRQSIAVGMVVTGFLLLLRRAGLWFGDGVVWPAALAVLGSAVIWTRGDDANRARWGNLMSRAPGHLTDAASGRGARIRLFLGAVVIVLGLTTFLTSNSPLALADNAPLAVVAAFTGVAVILGPGVWRLARQLAEERRERIRQEERAEMAAHLHDSVLQTLALIVRAESPGEMRTLARGQERELRAWLYGRAQQRNADMLSTAMDATAAEVEAMHGALIDVVMVGDCRLDDRVRALVDACREAMINAAKHSGAATASVYVEVEDDQVTAFVRDQGVGFERDRVPGDRRGIVDSITGRMERNGGNALVLTRPGEGTEVRLRISRAR